MTAGQKMPRQSRETSIGIRDLPHHPSENPIARAGPFLAPRQGLEAHSENLGRQRGPAKDPRINERQTLVGDYDVLS